MSAIYSDLPVTGKIVLITGASSGIGEATAYRFAEGGANLILTARRADRLEALKKTLTEKYKVSVYTSVFDMQDLEKVKEFATTLPDDFKEVDILINNAGLALGTNPAHTNDIEDAKTMINTNCLSVVALTKYILPGMVERNRGHMINISSVAGHFAYPGGSIYTGTKHFIDAFTQSARMDLVGSNVRVTAVSPGAVQTEFSNVRFKGDNSKADAVYAGINPLTAQDIADNVFYVATRPAHVQIGEMIVWATYQAAPTLVARVLLDKK